MNRCCARTLQAAKTIRGRKLFPAVHKKGTGGPTDSYEVGIFRAARALFVLLCACDLFVYDVAIELSPWRSLKSRNRIKHNSLSEGTCTPLRHNVDLGRDNAR